MSSIHVDEVSVKNNAIQSPYLLIEGKDTFIYIYGKRTFRLNKTDIDSYRLYINEYVLSGDDKTMKKCYKLIAKYLGQMSKLYQTLAV